VHDRVWEDALLAFAEDDFISEEESAYLTDLRRLLSQDRNTAIQIQDLSIYRV
jgi:hypothetical protein